MTLVAIAAGLSEDEFNKKRAKWEASSEKISEEFSAAGEDENKLGKIRAKMQALYSQRSEFMTELHNGLCLALSTKIEFLARADRSARYVRRVGSST